MLICQLTISLTIAFNSWRQYNRMLYDLSQVDLAAKSLKVTKRTQWSSYSIMPATYTSMLFALIYIDSILQPAKKLLVQFSCLSFYKYISLVIVKATHNISGVLYRIKLLFIQFLFGLCAYLLQSHNMLYNTYITCKELFITWVF